MNPKAAVGLGLRESQIAHRRLRKGNPEPLDHVRTLRGSMTDDQSIEGWDLKRRCDKRRKRHGELNCLHMQARDQSVSNRY
jgi:hypothetical protein